MIPGRRETQVFSGGGHQWGEAHGKGVESEYGGCILYPYMKIEE
jgi:hypothetical protein